MPRSKTKRLPSQKRQSRKSQQRYRSEDGTVANGVREDELMFIDLRSRDLRDLRPLISRLEVGQKVILFDNMTGMQTITKLVEKPNAKNGRPAFMFEDRSSFQLNRIGNLMDMTLENTTVAPPETLNQYQVKVEFKSFNGDSFKIPASSRVNYIDGSESTWAELLHRVKTYNTAKPYEVKGVVYVVIQMNDGLRQTSVGTQENLERVIRYPSYGA